MEPTGFSLAPRTFLDRALEPMESCGCEWCLWLCPGYLYRFCSGSLQLCPGCHPSSAQGHCSCELQWVCGWGWTIGEQFQINKDNLIYRYRGHLWDFRSLVLDSLTQEELDFLQLWMLGQRTGQTSSKVWESNHPGEGEAFPASSGGQRESSQQHFVTTGLTHSLLLQGLLLHSSKSIFLKRIFMNIVFFSYSESHEHQQRTLINLEITAMGFQGLRSIPCLGLIRQFLQLAFALVSSYLK